MIEIKAAAICGADMKHYNVDSGSDQFNSIRAHELPVQIVRIGDKVKDWKVGQRVVSDNSGHVCGVCPACEQGDFLCCTEKVNLGLDNNTWGGFSKYCPVPGEILKIHRHALWESHRALIGEEAAVLDLSVTYKSIAQQSKFLPAGTSWFWYRSIGALFRANGAHHGAVNIVMVGLEEDVAVRFPIAKELGATAVVNGSTEDVVTRCRKSAVKTTWAWLSNAPAPILPSNNLSKCCAPMGSGSRGHGFQTSRFSPSTTLPRGTKASLVIWPTILHLRRNAIRLLASGAIKVKPMITHRIGLSQWREGFDAMVDKTAIKGHHDLRL